MTRKLTFDQFNHAADRADRELAALREREKSAAARERSLVPCSGAAAAEPELTSRSADGRWQAPEVPSFVLEVCRHAAAWERAPMFVHAHFVRDLRKLSGSVDDARAVQMAAVDALEHALSYVAGMHSTWAALYTAVRRLAVRLESGFGDGEDDMGSLQRLQRRLFQTSAMLLTAYVIEQRGVTLRVDVSLLETPKPVAPAQRHREALRAAIARGDVVWTGDGP